MIVTSDQSSRQAGPVPDGSWDDFVSRHPDGDLLQTRAWARVKAPAHRSHLVVATDAAGSLTAGAQMLSRRLLGFVGVGYVPYGPLADEVDTAVEMIEALEAVARDAGLTALLIQPPRNRQDVGQSLEEMGYRQAPVNVATAATIEVDLRLGIDELRHRLSRSKRKNLKKSTKYGVEVRLGNRADLTVFHRLHVMTAERNRFLPMSLDYFQRQWDELGSAGQLELFMAEIDGRAVAAGIVTVFNGRVDFKLTGFDSSAEARRACPNDAVQWAMLEWSVSAGHDTFDLGGLPRGHAAQLLETDDAGQEFDDTGTRFKLGYNGTVELFPPTYERIVRPIGNLTYRLPASLMADDGPGGRIVNWLRRS